MNFGSSTLPRRSITRLLEIRQSLPVELDDVEPSCPAVSPMRPVAKLPIERVANEHLDHRGEFHHAGSGPHVPLVENERVGYVSTTRAQIRSQALRCDEGQEVDVQIRPEVAGCG